MLFIIDVNTTEEETMEMAVECISALISKKYKGVKVVGTAYNPKPKKTEKKTIETQPPEDMVEALPLLGGGEHYITKDDIAIYADAYPAIDPLAEIKKAKVWLMDNPKLKKTASGIKRFVNSWLARAQDSAVRKPQTASRPNLCKYESDSFDFDEVVKASMSDFMDKCNKFGGG